MWLKSESIGLYSSQISTPVIFWEKLGASSWGNCGLSLAGLYLVYHSFWFCSFPEKHFSSNIKGILCVTMYTWYYQWLVNTSHATAVRGERLSGICCVCHLEKRELIRGRESELTFTLLGAGKRQSINPTELERRNQETEELFAVLQVNTSWDFTPSWNLFILFDISTRLKNPMFLILCTLGCDVERCRPNNCAHWNILLSSLL